MAEKFEICLSLLVCQLRIVPTLSLWCLPIDILNEFNNYHSNLDFTVDRFDNCIPHFLDLEIHPDGLSIYRKDTHTAQFMHFSSFCKWNHKISWIQSLSSRAKRLCTANKLTAEIKNIVRFASCNGFPRWIARKIIRESINPRPKTIIEEECDLIYMFLPYTGKEAENVVLRCKKRLSKLFKKDLKVKFKIHFQTTRLSFFTSNKDKTPPLNNSNIVYKFSCPGCSQSYIGKTESTLYNRTKEHGWYDSKSAIHKHFKECPLWREIVDVFQIDGIEIDPKHFQINTVRQNTVILRKTDNWLKLAFLEALSIKDHAPELNKGIRSCKDLVLFWDVKYLTSRDTIVGETLPYCI